MNWEDLEKYYSPIAKMLPNGKVKVFLNPHMDQFEIRIVFDWTDSIMWFQSFISYTEAKNPQALQYFYNKMLLQINPYTKIIDYKMDFEELLK
jgi:hypothetical protein